MTHRRSAHHELLLQALISPECLVDYSAADWDLLIRLARRVRLLGRLAVALKDKNLLEKIPERAANQLISGLVQARKLQQQSRWELNRVLWALQDTNMPLIVLKGAAYSLAGIPESAGRMYVDLDLMARREDLAQIELILKQKGWKHQSLSSYDEHYYRAWSHEIPPLVHEERDTEVDIHHTIAPLTSQLKINADLFFETAVGVDNMKISLLSPADMVIHCAVNLFQNNELSDDLRDLLDLDDLLRFFSHQQQDFWEVLIERANQLRLGRLLFYGLYFCQDILGTTIPDNAMNRLNEQPGKIGLLVMHRLVPLALLPQHPDNPSRKVTMARTWLYLRSHWIRMPFYLLMPHLAYKTVLSVFPKKATARATDKE